jgi:hypothetical protein
LELHHLGVKTTFLHEDLEEEVFVSQSKGFERAREEHKVYKLSKALNRLR